MIWFGIEPLMEEDPDKFLQLSVASQIPVVTQYIARRAMDGDESQRLVDLIGKGGINTEDLLVGMLNGIEGRTDLQTPSNWKIVSGKLQKSNESEKALAKEISGLFGDKEATQSAFALLKDKKAQIDQRKRALQVLTAQQQSGLIAELPDLLKESDLRKDAIRSIAAFDSESLGRMLIDGYKDFNSEEQLEAVQTLSSRSRYGNMLTVEIKENRIPKKDVPANIARQLLRVVGSGFIEVWGPIEQVASDEAAYEKYRKMLSQAALLQGDVKQGKVLFQKSCGSCHKMYGDGGVMGPDLTGSNRADVNYILLNVLEPSAEIQDDYRMVVINTLDGRTYSGNVIGENQRQLTLRIVGQYEPLLINKSSIQSREVSEVSMMPPGLFQNLDEKEVVDLMVYLQTKKNVE